MNTLRDAFERQADNAGIPDLDIDELVGLGEHRLRRRRFTAVAAAGAAVALAIALAIGGTAWNRSADRQQGPIDHPTKPHQTQTTTPRPIVYSDVTFVPGQPNSLLGDPIHVGDRVVDTGSGFVHMAVTDDGVVYATGGYRDDGRLWFTDGGTPEQIASHACPSAHGWPGSIITGNSGSLVAWFDCTPKQTSGKPELVVYDTSSGREVGRVQAQGCSTETQATELVTEQCTAIIGDRVYVRNSVYIAHGDVLIVDDDGTGSSFAQDLRNNPRGLVVGDSWDTGTPTTAGVFVGVGRRLVPIKNEDLTSVFDTATRQPVHFHLPPGYQPDSKPETPSGYGADYQLFEWLDDDTIALESSGTGRHDQDILTCRLSTGRCELTVPSVGRNGHYRVVQNENLGNVEFG
jgi:hypothetical protein